MQLLYGNDGINYRMIDKSPEMTDAVQKALLSTYSKYEFVANPKAYSSRASEPEAVTYVTSNLDNQLSGDQVIVCKAGHMRNYSSPSYYFHCVMKEVPNDYYKKDFFEIFGYQFIKDLDIGEYSDGSIDQYTFPSVPVNQNGLTDEQLTVILSSFMANERKGQKTKILVDVSGDEYNARSRELLAAIYHCLPYELRKRYGFKTYCQEDKNLPARIAFILFNKDEMKEESECITLSDKITDIEGNVDKQYIEYAEYLVKELDDTGREKHFEALSRLVKNGRLSIQDCITYYSNFKSWASGSQEELLPEWIQYVDQNSFRKGALYEQMVEIIASKVDNEYYNKYLFDQVLKLYNESLYRLSPNAAKTIRFADCVKGLSVSEQEFHEWYFPTIQKKLNSGEGMSKSGIREKKKILEEEIRKLKETDIMSEQLKKLLDKEIYYLTRLLDSFSGQVQEDQERELEGFNRRIRAFRNAPIKDFAEFICAEKENICYPENLEILTLSVNEWLDEHFRTVFSSEKELKDYELSFEKLSADLSPEKCAEYRRFFENEKKRLEQEKEARIFTVEKGSVLKNYRNLSLYLEQGILDREDMVEVMISYPVVQMKAGRLEAVLGFILEPSEKTYPEIQDCFWELLKKGVFGTEHFEYLVRLAGPEEEQLFRLIRSYYETDGTVKISDCYAAEMISQYYPEQMKSLETFLDGEAYERLRREIHAAGRRSQKQPFEEEYGPRKERTKKKNVFGNLVGGRDRR